MPDKNNQGVNQPLDEIKSRSAQSGPPDDKERDSTQRGDQSGHEGVERTQRGTNRDEDEEAENVQPGQTGIPGRRPR